MLYLTNAFAVNDAPVIFGENTLLWCSADGTGVCTTGSAGTERYDNTDFEDTFDPYITIDDCIDGFYSIPFEGITYESDIFEYVQKIEIEDMNMTKENENVTDNFLRLDDTIKVSVFFMCYDGDYYSIFYKNNTGSDNNDWRLLELDVCTSTGIEPVSIEMKVDELVGNHTIRSIISYNELFEDVYCGYDVDPDYPDTDDIIFEVVEKLDKNAPSITPITPVDEERIEYYEGLVIPLEFEITDQTNVSFVNATLLTPNNITLLNLTKVGNIYYSNISNISDLGEYTLIFYANDTIETNSTQGTYNHINDYTNISFILKDDSSLTISNPQSFALSPFKIYNSTEVLLEFKVNDVIENLPFLEVYYILNGSANNIKQNILYGKYSEIGNYSSDYLNNSIGNISKSFTLSRNITAIDLSFLSLRIGSNLTNVSVQILNDNNGPNEVIAQGALFSSNQSFSWEKLTLNQSLNLIEGESYWINMPIENLSNFLLLGYNSTTSNISIRIHDAFNYSEILNGSEGLNSIRICENNTLDLICSFTQFKVDTTPPYLESISYASNVEFGSLQTINAVPKDAVSQISSATLQFNNTLYVMAKSGVNYVYSLNLTSIGNYSFNITFNDTLGWINGSGNYLFNISDKTPPSIVNLSNYPNTTTNIDPNITIFFNFTLFDLSNITEVKFQYRKNTTAIWTNSSPEKIDVGEYIANFTPDEESIYYYRIYAVDLFNNTLNSTQQNISVGFERTWTYSPILGQYDDVFMDIGETKEIYNFTISNTGDVPLLFNMTKHASSTLTISFSNQTFNLSKDENLTIFVSSLAPPIVNLPYNAKSKIACVGCSPSEGVVGGNVVVQGEGPYIDIKLVYVNEKGSEETSDSNTYSLYANDKNYNYSHKFRAKIENIGTMSAENISFFFNFTNTSLWILNITNPDNLSANFTLQALGQSGNKKNIDIIFLTKENINFSEVYTINASTLFGYNGSLFNNSQNAMIDISRYNSRSAPPFEICNNNQDDNLNGQVDEGCTSSSGGDGSNNQNNDPPQISSGGAGGGPAGAGAGLGGGLISYNISVIHPKNVDLFRGTNKTIQINITNPYKNKYFSGIKIGVSGYYPNYIFVNPKNIEKLEFNETRTINLTFSAPSYIGYSVNNLKLSFEYFAVSPGQNESSGDKMSVFKEMVLIINEVSREDSMRCLEESSKVIINATNLSYSTKLLKEKFEMQKNAVFSLDFTLSSKLCQEMKDDFESIIVYSQKISDMERKINDSRNLGYSLEDAKNLLAISKKQFSEGDYGLLENSLKDAETSYLISMNLEDADIMNRLYKFLSNNLKEIIGVIIILIFASYFVYIKLSKELIKSKIKNLELEKIEIDKNLKDLQKKYYFEKSISPDYFSLHTDKNKERIAKITQEILHNKSISLKFEKRAKTLDALNDKELKIKALMSDLQKQYYIDKSIDKKSFDDMIDSYNEELSDTKKNAMILKHKPKSKISLFNGKVASLFSRK